MATMAVAMPTAIAKPSRRGVLEMFIAFYNIARRNMHAPSGLCAPGARGLRSTYVKKAARRRPSLASAPIGSSSEGLWRLGGWERLTGGFQIVDRSGCATGIGHASSHRIYPRDRSDSRRRPVAALPNIPPRSDVRHSPFGAMSIARRRQLLVLGHFHCKIVTGRIGRSRRERGSPMPSPPRPHGPGRRPRSGDPTARG